MNLRFLPPILSALLAVSYVLGACGHSKPPPPVEPEVKETVADAGTEEEAPPAKSLYDRLGGKEGLVKIMDAFLSNAQIDPKLKNAFAKTTGAKADHFKQMMVELVCEQAGGDCKYSGKDMKAAHAGMKITEDQWNATLADLTLALDECKVSESDKSELFFLLSKMKDDIVGVKKKDDKKK